MTDLHDYAKRYLEMGLSVIPLRPKDKRPNLSQWDQYQNRRATEKEIDSWFKDTDNNLGIVCGKVSGNLVAVDFDDERAFRYCFSQADGLAQKTLCVRTSKGVHVYLRLEESTKKTTLRATGGIGKAKPSLPVDIQGEGGYVVAPPSIHPTGKSYAFISEVNEIAAIDGDQWTRFNEQMRDRAEEWPIVERLLPVWNEGSRQNLAMGVSGFFRKVMGFTEDRVVRITEGICQTTGDTEVGQRTSAVHATFSKDVDDVAIVNWLGEDVFSILKKVAPIRKSRRGHKGEGNTDDVDAIVDAGLYNPKAKDRIPTYDQIKDAIELCSSKKNEEMLWRIARACKFIGVESLAKYSAQEAVLAGNFFVTEDVKKPETYHYDPSTGIYQPNGQAIIEELVNRNIPDASAELISTVVKKVQTITRRPMQDFQGSEGIICVRNGILNLRTRELSPHTPEIIFLSRFNAVFDPHAKSAAFVKFIYEVLPSRFIWWVIEELGYLLKIGMPWAVIVLLIGDGRNGKTTLMNVIRALLGPGSYSTGTLRELSSDRFALADLYGMKANICGEVSDKPLNQTGLLKELSGGDPVRAQRKFLSPFSFVNAAKLWHGTNKLPFTPDITVAWWARIHAYPFPHFFMPNDPKTDAYLTKKLTTDEELSGILNLALAGLDRLEKNGRFSYGLSLEEVKELWMLSASTIHAWVEEEVTHDTESWLPSTAMHESYVKFCNRNDVIPIKYNKFFEELRSECPWIKDHKQIVEKGKPRVPGYYGIALKEKNLGRQQQLPESEEEDFGGEKQPGQTSGIPVCPGCPGNSQEVGGERVSPANADGGKVKFSETAQTTQTKVPETDSLATSVRAVAPTKDPLAILQTQMFDEKVNGLQQRACIGHYEHEIAILERSINIVAEIKGNGDKVSAFSLRKDLSVEFPEHPDTACRLIDGYYAEIVDLGSLLNQIRKSGGQP